MKTLRILLITIFLFEVIVFSPDVPRIVEQNNKSANSEENTVLNPVVTESPVEPAKNSSEYFVYPKSQIISEKEDVYVFENLDDPISISDWYRNRIKKSGANLINFSETLDNNFFNSKMIGEDGKTKIQVSVKKLQGSSKTIIGLIISR